MNDAKWHATWKFVAVFCVYFLVRAFLLLMFVFLYFGSLMTFLCRCCRRRFPCLHSFSSCVRLALKNFSHQKKNFFIAQKNQRKKIMNIHIWH